MAAILSKAELIERNKAICTLYESGATMTECGRRYGINRSRVHQILKKSGVWRPHHRSGRDKYLGVVVSEETKEALRIKAEAAGKSMSKFASDALDEVAK